MRSARAAAALLLVAAAASIPVGRDAYRTRAAREEVERSLRRAWALDSAQLRRQATAAGISLHRPEIRPLDTSRLEPGFDSAALGAFRQRCSSCHTAPDPSMHDASEWEAVVTRMDGWMDAAGLMPPDPEQRTLLLRFVEQAARRSAMPSPAAAEPVSP